MLRSTSVHSTKILTKTKKQIDEAEDCPRKTKTTLPTKAVIIHPTLYTRRLFPHRPTKLLYPTKTHNQPMTLPRLDFAHKQQTEKLHVTFFRSQSPFTRMMDENSNLHVLHTRMCRTRMFAEAGVLHSYTRFARLNIPLIAFGWS